VNRRVFSRLWLKRSILFVGIVAALLTTAFAFGAIFFDGPWRKSPPGNLVLGIAWLCVLVVLSIRCRRASWKRGFAIWFAMLALVMIPWSLISASNDREWQAPFRMTGRVTMEGDQMTFHHFRNFDYSMDGTVIEQWEDRTVRLSNLRALDYFHDAFGGNLLAHPFLSFDFGEDGRVCLSIETRRETHESFSTLGGLFKMFELQYLFGSEEDFVRVRTNIRQEPVYLYRLRFDPETVQTILMDAVAVQNQLAGHPRFYNVITGNCTTHLRRQTPKVRRKAFDWRMLVNGRLDEMVFERGGLVTDGLSFDALRAAAFINEEAVAAHNDPKFSNRIRMGRPGF